MICRNISLYPYNTFRIDVDARYMAEFRSRDELAELLETPEAGQAGLLVLGGGSNVLFTRDYDGLVLKNEIRGLEILAEDDDQVLLRVGSGENWHEFVTWCIDRGFAGVENLSLIPGSVGAGPMQNIGAYGVELKEVVESVEAWHIRDKQVHHFSNSDCAFGYRESVFKHRLKGEYVILSVTFRLSKRPDFRTAYGAIEQELDRMGVGVLSLRCVSQAVINIRRSKLPDPKELGNAGSFFKNPVVPQSVYESIRSADPEAPFYPAVPGYVKVPAGWLIERAGWKGFRRGACGVHERQSLVLVNYGGASGNEIYQLSEDLLQDVKRKFGVELEREVNVV